VSIFLLSASVPSPERSEQYLRIRDSQLHIDEAIISLSRAVFASGGRIVFGGHPTVVPLVCMVAAEYVSSTRASTLESPPSIVYQSEAYKDIVTEPQREMVSLGLSEERLVPAVDHERYDPRRRGEPQCERSLQQMRYQMISETKPQALICMGGMEGVEDEFAMFAELYPSRPIWLWAITGGATALLAGRYGYRPNVRVIDAELLNGLAERLQRRMPSRSAAGDRPAVVPYPYIMQVMVSDPNRSTHTLRGLSMASD
jgi:hypothetical protein